MTSFVRRCFATACAALGLAGALPASATNYSIDYTDLWGVATEAGWGINFMQNNNTLFASMFVYGPDSSPRWYFASSMTGSPNSYAGTLYRSTGPVFSGAFNPANFQPVAVGSMSVNFSSANAGTLSYSIDGVGVTKQIARNTFGTDNFAGNYLGGMVGTASNCGNTANNGPVLIFGFLSVTQSSSGVSMRVDFSTNSTCVFSGSYTPQGRLGQVTNGTMACNTGGTATNQGTFTVTQLETGIDAMGGVFNGRDQFCTYNGRFGGLKDTL